MDVYIVPKHIWERLSADDIATYDALDGVGSGPFTLTEWKPGQSWTMVANPNYWRRRAGDRPGRVPHLHQPATRWWPRCRRARSTPPT